VKTYITGSWEDGADTTEVRSPYSGDVVDTVPTASPDDVDRALAAAVEGAAQMAALPAHERAAALRRAAELVERDAEELRATITAEQGKHTVDAAAEASRIADIVLMPGARLCRVGRREPLDAALFGVFDPA
jgi:acyl-CoA reductase-like NAD-dependent aldehyde dehydrogenase